MRVVSDAALTAFDTSYQLGSTIAAGAYGQVCRSICRQTGRPVALKIIEKPPYETIPPCISDMAGHGPEEAETMELIANLDIDGVPKILDVFEDYLYEWLRRRSTVREDATILSVIMQLLTILDSLHGWGISHNDIKLENILLNDSGFTARSA
ncbi:cyclin-dependent kinase 3, putative [Perkinsus marinus ATCC 50983]|uniref:Cyclin-dependent kinase 3, putative n=2 Tax=Perkinsus marinus (strain ATCC 50983 / TXsc) TaxID=423536 RepID=C5KFZ4_PERM5|nr:cyclin-dependent kinase 3, putative [Perkinsus marinus ATCC 50983]EER16558.1 cyclin-dependent kinase 3, putative [Perkinsus marinus ATCC 50983]|eukprot:XP_002784762.1 cyclin-dependent kinase 3, putative [Perkinsus marinus ATCC 50983]